MKNVAGLLCVVLMLVGCSNVDTVPDIHPIVDKFYNIVDVQEE
ncbi:hypothetical protein [Alkalihalobacterium sp. APHAB7]